MEVSLSYIGGGGEWSLHEHQRTSKHEHQPNVIFRRLEYDVQRRQTVRDVRLWKNLKNI